MIKRIIFAAIFLAIMLMVSRAINSTFMLTVENTLAVDQVESSDAVAIAINSIDKWKGFIYLIEIIAIAGGLWLILGNFISKKLEKLLGEMAE